LFNNERMELFLKFLIHLCVDEWKFLRKVKLRVCLPTVLALAKVLQVVIETSRRRNAGAASNSDNRVSLLLC
jgi:hypothetical protein